MRGFSGFALFLTFTLQGAVSGESPSAEDKPPTYAAAAQKIAKRFEGKTPGVVLHIGDSITYANPYSAWARYGKGRTEEDLATLKWMHTNDSQHPERDGWHLARTDHPDGSRSHTAASGIRADQLLEGGYHKLPSFSAILKKYEPQAIVLMIGTNDASAERKVRHYLNDVREMVAVAQARGCVVILTTIPPHPFQRRLATAYNEVLRELAMQESLVLIDYEAEILKRRPNDWNGTLLGKDDVHPSGDRGETKIDSEPTEKNLANSGYLLRSWLTVKKLNEVKKHVFDPLMPKPKAKEPKKPMMDHGLKCLDYSAKVLGW
jgi:lysophospholipase L1-like esterase